MTQGQAFQQCANNDRWISAPARSARSENSVTFMCISDLNHLGTVQIVSLSASCNTCGTIVLRGSCELAHREGEHEKA